MRASDFLHAAVQHLEDRAVTYDKAGGERSMERTVAMFNALTDKRLTAEEGWLLMCCLKMVRAQQGSFKADSYEDGAAYFALAGEQAAQDRLGPISSKSQRKTKPTDTVHRGSGND